MSTFDAVVIGSGINGLVAAAELAQAGWSVALVERNPQVGGFIASGELTAPGYIHDTFSSWHVEFVTGGAYAELGEALAAHGLEYRNADGWVTGTVREDGTAILAHRDPAITAEAFAERADRDAYRAALRQTVADLPSIGALLGGELRSARSLKPLWALSRDGGVAGLEGRLRDTMTSGRSWCRRTFRGTEVDALWVPWLLHAGLSPDNASGAIMLPLFAASIHATGLPVVMGGAGRFVDAFRALLDARGVRVVTGDPVERILVEGGRAVGVVTATASELRARRAVLASVSPGALYGDLLPETAVPPRIHEEAARYRPGRAAMQIHLALTAPPAWRDERLGDIPLLHFSDGSTTTGIACAEAEAGLLPRAATVVVGQQSVLDPTRVPDGGATLWIQLQEVPSHPRGDAAGELTAAGRWTPDLAEAYADRVLDRIERHAPGLRDLVAGRAILTPDDLTAHNPNAIGGDPYGGATELDQRLLWRPLPSAGRHATPVDSLWHIGAATHPGPGLSGASGHMVAQALQRPPAATRARLRFALPRRGGA